MKITKLIIASLCLISFGFTSCSDVLNEDVKVQPKEVVSILDKGNVHYYTKSELTGAKVTIGTSLTQSQEKEKKGLSQKSFETEIDGISYNNKTIDVLKINWESCDWDEHTPKIAISIRRRDPNTNEIKAYPTAQVPETNIHYDKTKHELSFRYSFTLPDGLQRLDNTFDAALIIGDAVNENQDKENFMLMNITGNENDFIGWNIQTLEEYKTKDQSMKELKAVGNRINVPFGMSYTQIVPSETGNYGLLTGEAEMIGTLALVDITSDLYGGSVTPAQLVIQTDAFTSSGQFAFQPNQKDNYGFLSNSIKWSPVKEEEYEQIDHDEFISKPYFYNYKYPANQTQELTRNDNKVKTKFAIWFMPKPDGGSTIRDRFLFSDINRDMYSYNYNSAWHYIQKREKKDNNIIAKSGLLKNQFGKTINLHTKVTSDLMITGYYNYHDANNVNYTMLAIFNPTNHPIALKDYHISRILKYNDLPHNLGNSGKNPDLGGYGYMFQSYGYWTKGNNWNCYGMNPFGQDSAKRKIYKNSNIVNTSIDLTALQLCLDFNAAQGKQCHSLLGDRVQNIDPQYIIGTISDENKTKFNELHTEKQQGGYGVVNKDPILTCMDNRGLYLTLKNNRPSTASGYTADKPYQVADLSQVTISKEPFPFGSFATAAPGYNLEQTEELQPGKTMIICAEGFKRVFDRLNNKPNNEEDKNYLPWKDIFGIPAIKTDIDNGNIQCIVGVFNGYNNDTNSYATTSGDDVQEDAWTGTIQAGPKNGFILSKRHVYGDEQGKIKKVIYDYLDIIGPVNPSFGPNGLASTARTYSDCLGDWNDYAATDIPQSTDKTTQKRRFWITRKHGIIFPNSHWIFRKVNGNTNEIFEWNSPFFDKTEYTNNGIECDFGHHNMN